MSDLLFPAPPAPAAPVRGRTTRVAIRRIFCVGRNYEAHAKEMGVAVDREAPFYFTKAAEHYVPSGSTVPYPPGTSNYHYEVELVVVIGAPAFRIQADRALDCVFGYACGLDMTRRDLQQAAREARRPWDLGKDVEQSAVLSEIGRGNRSPGRRPHRTPRQRPGQATCRYLAAGSQGARGDCAPLGLLSPAPRRRDLHGHAGGRRPGHSRRYARWRHRWRRHHRTDNRDRRVAARRSNSEDGT
jgi:hypothetical protein